MTNRVHSAVVAEFLQNALAGDALRVPKLEARARAAGLLGVRQRISTAKPFRKAKSALGIQSIRDGVGPGGAWLCRRCAAALAPAQARPGRGPGRPTFAAASSKASCSGC